MTPQQWQTIDKSLADLTLQDKLELVTRLIRTIQAEVVVPSNRVREQLENLSALRRKLATMPTAPIADGLSNRDHDQILYGAAS